MNDAWVRRHREVSSVTGLDGDFEARYGFRARAARLRGGGARAVPLAERAGP